MSPKRLHRLAANPAVARSVALVERLDRRDTRLLRVLTYHRVDEPEPFGAHLAHLARHFQPVSVAQILTALDGGPALPERALLLTFDDAYRNFATVAWPQLARAGFPAVLFVPTAFPDRGRERFWWDALAEAFARTERRTPLATPSGLLALESAAQRAHAHRLVKAHVKDLPHAETLAETRRVCKELGVEPGAHEVLSWDELRALAAAGVTLGAHSRTHPRLDRVPFDEARAEILDSVAELERELAPGPRVFAYPDGRFDDRLVEVARAAGIELAFTTRRGTNRLDRCDPLRLRRLAVDARDPLPVLRAKLAAGAAWFAPLHERLADPASAAERAARARHGRSLRRTRLVLRPLDAALTAQLRPRRGFFAGLGRVVRPGAARYERVGELVQLVTTRLPALRERLDRRLLERSRLPFGAGALELIGFGSGTTVFRLETPGRAALALKVYRRSLGREPAWLAGMARRYRQRYRHLAGHFGADLLPGEFLVLHAPLRGQQAVACVQPFLEGPLLDLFALSDAELLAALARHEREAAFAAFARRLLAAHAGGFSPDLLGRGNLVLTGPADGRRLVLIDYGGFLHRELPPEGAQRRALDALNARVGALLERTERHALHP